MEKLVKKIQSRKPPATTADTTTAIDTTADTAATTSKVW
jgi:hypothetical protein